MTYTSNQTMVRRTPLHLGMLSLALALAMPLQSNAQSHFDNKSPEWWHGFSKQLVVLLDSPIPKVQEQALSHIIFFANQYPDKMDLDPATGRILDLYRSDEMEARRTLALMALHAIGNEAAMRKLNTLVRYETSPRIENLTRAVLSEYYGG